MVYPRLFSFMIVLSITNHVEGGLWLFHERNRQIVLGKTRGPKELFPIIVKRRSRHSCVSNFKEQVVESATELQAAAAGRVDREHTIIGLVFFARVNANRKRYPY